MTPKISAYLAMDEYTLTSGESGAAAEAGGEWVVVNHIGGRKLVSALAPEAAIPSLMSMLAPHHPRLLGVWDEQGVALVAYPVRTAEYIEVMPDDITMAPNPTDPPIVTRPTVARDVCGWAGWMPRSFS